MTEEPNERSVVDDMISELRPMIEQINALYNMAYDQYISQAEALLNSGSYDETQIKVLLDNLIDFCGDKRFLDIYKALCRALVSISPKDAVDYVLLYRSVYEDETSGALPMER